MASGPEPSDFDTAEHLYHTAQHYLGQVLQLLETTVTKDAQLQHCSTRSAGSTLGKHLRHLHDHYRLLLDAVPDESESSGSSDRSSPPPPLKVNYDIRSRNGDAENHHAACVDSFRHLSDRLRRVTDSGRAIAASRKIVLTAVTPQEVNVESTWGRELWFVSFHAVHHYALVRVLLDEQGLTVSDDFGVAPSTLVHRHELQPNKL